MSDTGFGMSSVPAQQWRPRVIKSTDYAAKDAVNIGRIRGREFHFGNPFSHKTNSLASVDVMTRDEAIDCFRKWILEEDFLGVEPIRRAWIHQNLHTLKGRDLACPGNCAPNRCHGDVLLELANKEVQ